MGKKKEKRNTSVGDPVEKRDRQVAGASYKLSMQV